MAGLRDTTLSFGCDGLHALICQKRNRVRCSLSGIGVCPGGIDGLPGFGDKSRIVGHLQNMDMLLQCARIDVGLMCVKLWMLAGRGRTRGKTMSKRRGQSRLR